MNHEIEIAGGAAPLREPGGDEGQANGHRPSPTGPPVVIPQKTCSKCQRLLPILEFSPRGNRHASRCKRCHREEMRTITITDRERCRERSRVQRREHSEAVARWQRAWREKNKEKIDAKNEARRAGVQPPGVCSGCGTTGRRLEGHHEDYTKALDVVWLCRACHALRHRELKDEREG